MSDPAPAVDPPESRALHLALVAFAAVVPVAAYAYLLPITELRLDETVHVPQVALFLEEGFALHPRLTMLPGLHLLVAAAEAATGVRALWLPRLVGLLGGLALVFGSSWAARVLSPSRAGWRVAQVAALPLVAPLCGLFYTDVAGVALLVLAGAALLRRRVVLGAALLLAMVAARHSLVGFAAWMTTLSALAEWCRRDGLPGERARAVLRSQAPLLLPLLAFGVAAALMGGLTAGDHEFHPAGLRFANVPLSLVVLGVALAPSHVRAAPRVWALVQRWPLPTLGVVFVFAFCAATAVPDHPFNDAAIDYTLPNRAIDWLFRAPLGRAALIVVSAYVPLSFATWRWRWGLLAPASLALLWALRMSASWLVEPRYTMPFVVVILLAREREPRALEALYVAGYLALSTYFLWGIHQDAWFPL